MVGTLLIAITCRWKNLLVAKYIVTIALISSLNLIACSHETSSFKKTKKELTDVIYSEYLQCGDNLYKFSTSSKYIRQLKNMKIEFSPVDLTETDLKNNIQWKCFYSENYSSQRSWKKSTGWSNWKEPTSMSPLI